jgi:hypothetical protein
VIKDKGGKSIDQNLEGDIKGEQITWKTVGANVKTNVKLLLKNDTLVGTWSNSIDEGGEVTFILSK